MLNIMSELVVAILKKFINPTFLKFVIFMGSKTFIFIHKNYSFKTKMVSFTMNFNKHMFEFIYLTRVKKCQTIPKIFNPKVWSKYNRVIKQTPCILK
jgi:hypothetical protein